MLCIESHPYGTNSDEDVSLSDGSIGFRALASGCVLLVFFHTSIPGTEKNKITKKIKKIPQTYSPYIILNLSPTCLTVAAVQSVCR